MNNPQSTYQASTTHGSNYSNVKSHAVDYNNNTFQSRHFAPLVDSHYHSKRVEETVTTSPSNKPVAPIAEQSLYSKEKSGSLATASNNSIAIQPPTAPHQTHPFNVPVPSELTKACFDLIKARVILQQQQQKMNIDQSSSSNKDEATTTMFGKEHSPAFLSLQRHSTPNHHHVRASENLANGSQQLAFDFYNQRSSADSGDWRAARSTSLSQASSHDTATNSSAASSVYSSTASVSPPHVLSKHAKILAYHSQQSLNAKREEDAKSSTASFSKNLSGSVNNTAAVSITAAVSSTPLGHRLSMSSSCSHISSSPRPAELTARSNNVHTSETVDAAASLLHMSKKPKISSNLLNESSIDRYFYSTLQHGTNNADNKQQTFGGDSGLSRTPQHHHAIDEPSLHQHYSNSAHHHNFKHHPFYSDAAYDHQRSSYSNHHSSNHAPESSTRYLQHHRSSLGGGSGVDKSGSDASSSLAPQVVVVTRRPKSTFPFGRCRVCNDKATGVHYGIATCEGCKVCLFIHLTDISIVYHYKSNLRVNLSALIKNRNKLAVTNLPFAQNFGENDAEKCQCC
jgi:hypothetical protein